MHKFTLTDIKISVAVATAVDTPAAELARTRTATDSKATLKVVQGSPAPRTSHLQDFLFKVLVAMITLRFLSSIAGGVDADQISVRKPSRFALCGMFEAHNMSNPS